MDVDLDDNIRQDSGEGLTDTPRSASLQQPSARRSETKAVSLVFATKRMSHLTRSSSAFLPSRKPSTIKRPLPLATNRADEVGNSSNAGRLNEAGLSCSSWPSHILASCSQSTT